MAISDIIKSTTSLASAQIQTPNFGTPLILANGDNKASWGSDVVRSYSAITDVAADFATSTGTYLMAEALFEQSPNPGLILIGLRATSSTTQVFYMDIAAGGLTYLSGLGAVNFTVNANAFSYTGVSGDSTHDTAIGHLVSALTGASWYGASGLTITPNTANGPGAHLVEVTCTAATINDIVIPPAMLSYLILYQGQGVAGSGGSSTQTLMAADINAINQQNSGWYTALSPFTSPIEVAAIANAVLALQKTLLYQTSDTNNITVSASADAGLAAATPAPTNPPVTGVSASIFALQKAQGATLDGVHGMYTQTLLNFSDAALAGARLWTTPGSENWAYVSLSGVTAAVLTDTQRDNVVGTIGNIAAGKYANVYESVAGVNITEFGITRGGQFFDTVRFLAWVNATIQTTILQALVAASAGGTKIPYTQDGITYICGLVLGVLKQGVAAGGFANIPAPTVPIPAISSISGTNLTARNLPNISWTATLAGAINTVQVQGLVTV